MNKLKDLYNYKNATKEQLEEAREFYKEYYGVSLKPAGQNKYINDPSEIKEAHRRFNQLKTDLFDVKDRAGELSRYMAHEDYDQFMEDASDDWEWQDVFKQHGFEEALRTIVQQAERDIENKNISNETVLGSLISKWERLRKMNERDKREKRKHEKK